MGARPQLHAGGMTARSKSAADWKRVNQANEGILASRIILGEVEV